MNTNVAIKVSNISKSFKLPHEKHDSLKDKAVHIFGPKNYTEFKVLKDIDFEIMKGEFFGIVGKNGSGKSTLLKILANIYQPTSGKVKINGTLAPFIELGVGFNPELTGRENVFLSGTILGLTRKRIGAIYDEIVDFAEMREFMDQKLKNYSSGMQVRLAFSIAVRAESNILLIDEVLAVGDAAFQAKCFDYFYQLKESGKTIVFVTHDMSAILQFCDRAIFIDQGDVVKLGTPDEVSELYLKKNYERKSKGVGESPNVKQISLIQNNKKTRTLDNKSLSKIILKYHNPTSGPIHFGFQIFNDKNVYCFGTNTKISGLKPTQIDDGTMTIEFLPNLVKGLYYINLAIMDSNAARSIDYLPKAIEFRMADDSKIDGITIINVTWKNKVV